MESKRGKRLKFLIILLIVLIFLLLFVIMFFNKSIISGNTILSPQIPSDCSDISIKSLWDSIYLESSSNIHIYTNASTSGVCNNIIAYKINDNYLYYLKSSSSIANYKKTSSIIASFIEINPQILTSINQITNIINAESTLNTALSPSNETQRSLGINDVSSEITRIFKVEVSSFSKETDSTYSTSELKATYLEVLDNKNRTVSAVSRQNYSLSYLRTDEIELLPCTSNWVETNTTCNSSEYITTYYNDSNLCPIPTDIPEVKKRNCDYNQDNIYGNKDDLNSRLANSMGVTVNLYINGTSNLSSQNFTNSLQKVEIKSASPLVEFNWNFSNPLDLNNIYIDMGLTNDSREYIILKNISANKTVYLYQVNNSGMVCIRNSEIASISAISKDCNRVDRNEIKLTCPGTSNNITCSIESDNSYKIQGLTHSGVVEYVGQTGPCTQKWICLNYSSCVNGTQTRTCYDENSCHNSTGKPITNQSCSSTNNSNPITNSSNPQTCTPSFTDCSSYSACENNKKTRICKDANKCQGSNNKTESEDCSSNSSDKKTYLFFGLIGIIGFAIIIVIILIFKSLLSHGPKKEKSIFTN